MHSYIASAKIRKNRGHVKEMIRFIHTADLHLDSPFKKISAMPKNVVADVRNSIYLSFQQLITVAIKQRVDFVLIVGDIFDQAQQSMKAHMTLIKGFKELQKYNIQVYVSYGNHDYLSCHTFPRNYPENVHIFEKEKVEQFDYRKDGKVVAKIYGFSYEERVVDTNMVPQYQITEEAPYHIATLHGSLGSITDTNHETYAPFQLQELKQKQFDYWALGHIHTRQIISTNPYVVYPGNIQGRSMKEVGDKGCYLVTYNGYETQLDFIPLHTVTFKKTTIEASNMEESTDVYLSLESLVQKNMKDKKKVMIEVTLENTSLKLEEWNRNGQLKEIMTLLNDRFSNEENWVQISVIKLKKQKLPREWYEGKDFLGQLHIAFQQNDKMRTLLDSLWNHPSGRKWLDTISEEELEDWTLEAENMATYLLQVGGEKE